MVKVCYLDRVGTENSVSCPLLLRIHGIKMHMGFNWKKLCQLLGNRAEATPRRSEKWSVTYGIGSVPHFGVEWTGIRTVAEVNK